MPLGPSNCVLRISESVGPTMRMRASGTAIASPMTATLPAYVFPAPRPPRRNHVRQTPAAGGRRLDRTPPERRVVVPGEHFGLAEPQVLGDGGARSEPGREPPRAAELRAELAHGEFGERVPPPP